MARKGSMYSYESKPPDPSSMVSSGLCFASIAVYHSCHEKKGFG